MTYRRAGRPELSGMPGPDRTVQPPKLSGHRALLLKVCFMREGTSTVHGKHFFLFNFSLAIMLEMFCYLNIFADGKCGERLSHQHQSFSRYETC